MYNTDHSQFYLNMCSKFISCFLCEVEEQTVLYIRLLYLMWINL